LLLADSGFEEEDEEALDVELDPGTMALLERASRALDNPDLDVALAAQLRQAVANIRQAAANGDADDVQVLCDALIDVLFEAEE
jgi:hypothetical protein